MQDADGGHFAQVPESKDQVIKPERVLVLSKSMRVRWRQLEAGLQGVKSLDDVMRIDLHYLSRWGHLSAYKMPSPMSGHPGQLGQNRGQSCRVTTAFGKWLRANPYRPQLVEIDT